MHAAQSSGHNLWEQSCGKDCFTPTSRFFLLFFGVTKLLFHKVRIPSFEMYWHSRIWSILLILKLQWMPLQRERVNNEGFMFLRFSAVSLEWSFFDKRLRLEKRRGMKDSRSFFDDMTNTGDDQICFCAEVCLKVCSFLERKFPYWWCVRLASRILCLFDWH